MRTIEGIALWFALMIGFRVAVGALGVAVAVLRHGIKVE